MARVPLQTQLTQEYKGGEVQLSPQTVEPFESAAPDNLKAAGKALTSVSDVVGKLDDELNDAESKRLWNEFYVEADTISKEFLSLEGALALNTVPSEKEGEEPKRQYDVYMEKITTLLDSYAGRASNGEVKFMFNSMADVTVASAQSRMTTHSLIEQRKYNDKETLLKISNHQNASINDAIGWQDPGSAHNTNRIAGLTLLEEYAQSKNMITSGENVSGQWLELLSAYNLTIHLGVIDALDKAGKQDQIPLYIEAHRQKGEISQEDAEALLQNFRENTKEYNGEKIVDHILTNNDPTDYGFANQSNLLLCLASNNNEDNNNGGLCIDGFHTNELNPSDFEEDERIGILEQVRNQSIFFQPGATKTISEVNQPTHLFAIQHIGVEKADKFYTKALNSVEIDQERYKTDEAYKREIDAKVLDKFNTLFKEEINKKFTSNEPEPKREDFDNTRSGSKQYEEAKALWKLNNKKYANQVLNDIDILQEGVRYKDVNPISGLQPLSVYQELLKRTIKDEKQLAFALEDLELKHNALRIGKENEYNQNLLKAQAIAFAEPGGWKKLEENGIDIKMFLPEDQQKLKNGQPDESNKDVVMQLIANPGELVNNLDNYRVQLNDKDYNKLLEKAESYRKNGVETVNIEQNMLKFELSKAGFGDWDDTDAADWQKDGLIEIEDAWRNAIAEEEKVTGKKVSRERKRELLKDILDNKVILDFTGENPWYFPIGGKDVSVPLKTINEDEFDNIYVKVYGKTIWLKDINKFQRARIEAILKENGEPVTELNVATYWVDAGKPTADNVKDHNKYSEEKELGTMQ